MGLAHGLRRGAFVLAGLALGGALLARDARFAHAEDPPEKGVKAVPASHQETTIEDFLKSVGSRIKVAWDPSTKLIKDKRIVGVDLTGDQARVLSFVRKVLVAYDLVMIPMGMEAERWYYVVDAKQQGAVLRLKPEVIDLNDQNLARYEGEDGLFVSATIPIRALNTLRDARTALTRVSTQNLGNVTEVPDASAFVVTDFAPTVVAIYRLIRQLDVAPSPESPGRLVALQHARAENVARLLSAHVAPPAPGPVRQQAQPDGSSPPGPGPRVSADARTNQILVGGTPSEVEALVKLIHGLDVPVEPPPPAPAQAAAQQPSASVLTLKQANAQELSRVLQNLVNGSTVWMGPDGMRPAFVPGPVPNLLVVAAPEKSMPAIRALVESLDVPVVPKEPPPAPPDPVAVATERLKQPMSLHVEDRKLGDVLGQLASATASLGVHLDFPEEIAARKVTLDSHDLSAWQLLDVLTKAHGLAWKVQPGNSVHIVPATEAERLERVKVIPAR